jgi:hypothetical protein
MVETALLERDEPGITLVLDGPLRPWGLWDLLSAYAAAFHRVAERFAAISFLLAKVGDGPIPDLLSKELAEALDFTYDWLGSLQAIRSYETVFELQSLIKYGPAPTAIGVHHRLETLSGLIQRELNDRFLYFVPDDLPGLCFTPRGGWGEAPDKFKIAATDIDEASFCLGLGRTTASVFHLMRTLEYGLIVLAKDVGVALPLPDGWHRLIVAIEAQIGRMSLPREHQDYVSKSPGERQFYAEAAHQFRYFKDAYRDYVTHTSRFYEQPEALGIYGRVRDFMMHLATRLAE